MTDIHQRRKTDRERQMRWRKKKLAEGNRQIHVMLTPAARKILDRERDRTGEPYVRIINRLIVEKGRELPRPADEIEVWHPG